MYSVSISVNRDKEVNVSFADSAVFTRLEISMIEIEFDIVVNDLLYSGVYSVQYNARIRKEEVGKGSK